MESTQLSDRVVITSGPLGVHVKCTDDIRAGERLFTIVGRLVSRADRYSIQIGRGAHLTPDGAPWSFVNHACVPNTAIDFKRWELYAIGAIRAGEELGWNYETTEWALSCPFPCQCGAPECDRTIRGFKYLDIDSRLRLRSLLSPYLETRFAHHGASTANVRVDTAGTPASATP